MPQTIRQGSNNGDVGKWQAIIGAAVDNVFGPETKEKTIAWQKAHGLDADGVVGPKTWAAAGQAVAAQAQKNLETVAAVASRSLATGTPPPPTRTPIVVPRTPVEHVKAAASKAKDVVAEHVIAPVKEQTSALSVPMRIVAAGVAAFAGLIGWKALHKR